MIKRDLLRKNQKWQDWKSLRLMNSKKNLKHILKNICLVSDIGSKLSPKSAHKSRVARKLQIRAENNNKKKRPQQLAEVFLRELMYKYLDFADIIHLFLCQYLGESTRNPPTMLPSV